MCCPLCSLVLQAQPTFAEARSKALVPLFLSFLRDTYFPSGSAVDRDIDAIELALPEVLEALLSRQTVSAAKALASQQRKVSKTGAAMLTDATTADMPVFPSAVSGTIWWSLASTDATLEQLVLAQKHAVAVESDTDTVHDLQPLSRHAAAARLLSYLGMFKAFRNWDGMFGRDAVHAVVLRLLARAEGGIGEAALRVLLAMKVRNILHSRCF
jgi:hypothetical protein